MEISLSHVLIACGLNCFMATVRFFQSRYAETVAHLLVVTVVLIGFLRLIGVV